MDSIQVRRLSESDMNIIKDLWISAGSLFKESYDFSNQSLDSFLKDPSIELYGAFFGDALVGTIGVKIWGQLPYFSLINMVFRKTEITGLRSAYIIDYLLNFILNHMHSQGRFTFYIATLTRHHQLKIYFETGKVRHAKYFRALDNYEIHVEAVINPGEISPFGVFASLCGNRSHSRQIWIRRYSLTAQKQKTYRTEASFFANQETSN